MQKRRIITEAESRKPATQKSDLGLMPNRAGQYRRQRQGTLRQKIRGLTVWRSCISATESKNQIMAEKNQDQTSSLMQTTYVPPGLRSPEEFHNFLMACEEIMEKEREQMRKAHPDWTKEQVEDAVGMMFFD